MCFSLEVKDVSDVLDPLGPSLVLRLPEGPGYQIAFLVLDAKHSLLNTEKINDSLIEYTRKYLNRNSIRKIINNIIEIVWASILIRSIQNKFFRVPKSSTVVNQLAGRPASRSIR